ncbi:DUF4238 domain-containing protein [Methylobacterium sp. NI91]|nr:MULTISPECIES: DUF4238 domain-containing protein [unclassified Methylobacterium]QIJ75060.1 DUF4238 domain-containing protein [Methylobacterium sp. CLZ]QIJ79964.1 DUF4238 domain-containing protein [Methylobacterium sp. NI91]
MAEYAPQQQVSWRHHYIPEFYLKRWCAGNGKLVEFSKPYGNEVKPKRVSPRQTGFIDRLYALEGLPESLSSQVEDDFFRPVDNRAADVLKKIESDTNNLEAEERVAWTQFLISLIFRTPENVSATRKRLSDSLTATTRAAERRWRRIRGPGFPRTLREAMEQAIASDPMRVSRYALEVVAGNTSSEKIGNAIVRMLWGSMRMPMGIPGLFSSDRPLHWFGGLGDADCHILMPVGPKRIFWATNTIDMAALIRSQPPEILARFVNEHSVRRARKFVYAMSDMELAYVQANMGIDQESSIVDLMTKLPSDKELRERTRRFGPSRVRRNASAAALFQPRK